MAESTIAEQYHAGEVTDMKISRLSDKQLEKELFNKSPNEIIDAYEIEKGIKPGTQKQLNTRKDVQIFDISVPRDKKLYQALINNPRYAVHAQKDHFSNLTSRYTIVCYYEEDMDSKHPPTVIEEDEE